MKFKIVVTYVVTLSLASIFGNVAAKSFGGSRGSSSSGGWGSSKSSSSSSSSSSYGTGSTSSKYGTGKNYGSSSSSSSTFGRGYPTYNRYPSGGYGPGFYSGFFLYNGHYRRNNYYHNNQNHGDDNDYVEDNFEDYFDRVEEGCEIVGVDSYRTIDSFNTSDSEWEGCSEEWKYNVQVKGNASDTSFVSPPLELYSCELYDSCAECQDELRGVNFYALGLEDFNFGNGTYLVDCYVPKNRTLVNETFDCTNDDCIFMSERYASSSSPSTAAIATSVLYWTALVSSGIATSMFSFFA